MIRTFNAAGYGHLYRSLMRFCSMSSGEASSLVAMIRSANLDSYCRENIGTWVEVPIMNDFYRGYRRPYFTEVQLYKAMKILEANIAWQGLTSGQKEEIRHLRCIMEDVKEQFWRAYGMELEDGRTVYADCADDLEPGGREPCVCLREHWCMNGCLNF